MHSCHCIFYFWLMCALVFILRVGNIRDLNLIWIKNEFCKSIKGLDNIKVFLFSAWPAGQNTFFSFGAGPARPPLASPEHNPGHGPAHPRKSPPGQNTLPGHLTQLDPRVNPTYQVAAPPCPPTRAGDATSALPLPLACRQPAVHLVHFVCAPLALTPSEETWS
jgi:hypothetical protein